METVVDLVLDSANTKTSFGEGTTVRLSYIAVGIGGIKQQYASSVMVRSLIDECMCIYISYIIFVEFSNGWLLLICLHVVFLLLAAANPPSSPSCSSRLS